MPRRNQIRCRRAVAAVLLTAAVSAPAWAQEATRLPDTEITRACGVTAYLTEPTTRYGHGVLGDAIEAGGFAVVADGRTATFRLPPDSVFEDRRVRLADLDGDGRPEAILVRAYLARGAAIAVYRIRRDRIEPLAESAAIGTPNRWLNPVGVADFAGSGEPLIAAVVTPHLAGSLRFYRLAGSRLDEIGRLDGFTNHIIGSRDLDLGRIADVDGDATPEIVLPTLDRTALAVVSFRGGKTRVVATHAIGAKIVELDISGGTARLALADGSRVALDLGQR